jgi:hypothetical protein
VSGDGGSLVMTWLGVVVVAAAAVAAVAKTVVVEKAVIVAGVEALVCVNSLSPSEIFFKLILNLTLTEL